MKKKDTGQRIPHIRNIAHDHFTKVVGFIMWIVHVIMNVTTLTQTLTHIINSKEKSNIYCMQQT